MKFCKMQRTLSFEDIDPWFTYNQRTGVITWKKSTNSSVVVGNRAGHIKDNRRRIGFRGMCVWEHRLAWLLHTGEWPNIEIDHINGCPTDNRIKNLRLATRLENANNKIHVKPNGLPPGVRFRPAKYEAAVYTKGERHFLGWFNDLSEATRVVIEKGRKIKGNAWADRMVETYAHLL